MKQSYTGDDSIVLTIEKNINGSLVINFDENKFEKPQGESSLRYKGLETKDRGHLQEEICKRVNIIDEKIEKNIIQNIENQFKVHEELTKSQHQEIQNSSEKIQNQLKELDELLNSKFHESKLTSQNLQNQITELKDFTISKYEENFNSQKEIQEKLNFILEKLIILTPSDKSIKVHSLHPEPVPELNSEINKYLRLDQINTSISDELLKTINERETCIRIHSNHDIKEIIETAKTSMQKKNNIEHFSELNFHINQIESINNKINELTLSYDKKLEKKEEEVKNLEVSLYNLRRDSERLKEDFNSLQNSSFQYESFCQSLKEQSMRMESMGKNIENMYKDFKIGQSIDLRGSRYSPEASFQHSLEYSQFLSNFEAKFNLKVFSEFEVFKVNISESLQVHQEIIKEKVKKIQGNFEKLENKFEEFFKNASFKSNYTMENHIVGEILDEIEKLEPMNVRTDRFDQVYNNYEKFAKEFDT